MIRPAIFVGAIASVLALPWASGVVLGRAAPPPMAAVCATSEAGGATACVAAPDGPGSVVIAAPLENAAEASAEVSKGIAAAAGPESGNAPPAWMPRLCVDLWPTFAEAGAAHGVAPSLLAMISLIESGCGGAARTSLRQGVITSSAGAAGVMQIMPATAAGIANNRGLSLPNDWRTNAALQIDYAAWLFAGYMRAYGQDAAIDPDYREAIRVSCIAYNGGPRAVMRYRAGNPPAESMLHAGFVVGMWTERAAAESPTFARWAEAGGWQWINE